MTNPKTPPKRHPASVPTPPLHRSNDVHEPPLSYHGGVEGTPPSFKVSGSEKFTTPQAEKSRNQRYKALAREARGHFVGPVNPSWFVNHYLIIQEKIDSKTHTCPPFPHIVPKWTQLTKNLREADMYEPIVSNSL